MFLKRSLVMTVGVLLFIGAFLLKFHLSEAHLEDTFKQERVKYGVDETVLTLPEASPPIPPPAVVTPVSTAPATPPPAVSSDDSSATNAAPGNSTDPNMIIGPVPPSVAPVPAPEPEPVPAPDTNSGGPMMPSPTTMNGSPSPFLIMAAYHPSDMALHVAEYKTEETTNQAPVESSKTPGTNAVPATPASTNSTAISPATSSNAVLRPPIILTTPHTPPVKIGPMPARATLAGGRAIVLGFHQFTGPGVGSKNIYSMSQDVFDFEMKYLHDNGYNVVPLSDIVRFVKHETSLPPNAVAITIDDGYKSAIVYAAPVLKKYGFPWTYFVYPAFITRTEGKGAASWPDLVELGKEGVDVECHSMTHPQLTKKIQKFNSPHSRLLSPEEYEQFLTYETVDAKAILEKELGKKIKYFAYPYGDYNKQVEAAVVAAGFDAVFTVADNPVHITTDVHSIGRYIITKPVERAFTSYLHQGALSLAEVTPEPGATTSDPRPVITAVLGFNGDPASLETEVRDFGVVRHDFDPQTSTVRLYLPRDLIQPEVIVSVRAKDEQTGQTMVGNWHFNYEPATGTPAAAHQPIGAGPLTDPSTDRAVVQPPAISTPVATNLPPAPTPSATTNPPPVIAPVEAPTNTAAPVASPATKP